jgi:hypothetical protein
MLLRDNVYENLRSDILTCRLAPGDDMHVALIEAMQRREAPCASSRRMFCKPKSACCRRSSATR